MVAQDYDGINKKKAMAQRRRLGRDMGPTRHMERHWVASDHSHDDFWGRETIPEVGGAYLFETPRSGVRKMPKFLDYRTSDDDNHCDDDDHYDSGAYKPKNSEDIRYKPNTSWRRCPHAGTTMTSQSHTRSIRPIGKPRNN